MNITKVHITPLEANKVLALASITIDNDFVVSGLRVLNGSKGLWVSMPSRKNKDNEYKDIAYPITKEARETLQQAVINKYKEQTDQFVNEEAKQVYNTIHREDTKPIEVNEEDLPF